MLSPYFRFFARALLMAGLPAMLVFGKPSSGAAQDGGGSQFKAELIKVGDRPPAEFNLRQIPLNRQECEEDIEFEILLQNVPRRNIIALWVGSNCNEDRTLMTNCEPIREVPIPITVTGDIPLLQIELTLREVLEAFNQSCENQAANLQVWVMPVDNADERAPVSTYATVDLRLRTIAPRAPTAFQGGVGMTQTTVSWRSDDQDVNGFIVYIDRNAPAEGVDIPEPTEPTEPEGLDAGLADAGVDEELMGAAGAAGLADDGLVPAECVSAYLIPGQPPPDPDDLPQGVSIKRISTLSARSADINLNLSEDNPIAAAGVASVDISGNISALSNVGCLTYRDTYGWWDIYKARGGTAEPGCRVAATDDAKGHWPLALAVVGLVCSARWRRGSSTRRRRRGSNMARRRHQP